MHSRLLQCRHPSPGQSSIGRVGQNSIGADKVDYTMMFGGMAKWVAQIESPDRVTEFVSRAFHVACAGRPGPVVLALPEDMLVEFAAEREIRLFKPVQASPAAADLTRLVELLENAQRPLLLLGGSGWNPGACRQLELFAQANNLPVACAFRFQDLFDNEHPNYVGDVGVGINPALAQRIRNTDLLVAIGPRLGEMTTSGYTLLESPAPKQQLVHVHAGAEELGSVYDGELLINSGMAQFAQALADLPKLKNWKRWGTLTQEARSEFETWTRRVTIPGDVQMWDVQRLTGEQARVLEPALCCTAALFSPSMGIVDSHVFMHQLLGDAEAQGAAIAFNSTVEAGASTGNAIALRVRSDGECTDIAARQVVNAAGLHSCQVASSFCGIQPGSVPRAVFAKGSYFSIAKRVPFTRLIYPVPEPGGLGVHLTLDLGGQARFGPDVEWLEGTHPDDFDFHVDARRAEGFYTQIRRYWPELPDGSLQPSYSGVRPKVSAEKDADFVIQDAAPLGVPGLVNLLGIESPGLTASLAVARSVRQLLRKYE